MKKCEHKFRSISILEDWWVGKYFILYKCSRCQNIKWIEANVLENIEDEQ